jgi:CRP-like cAMP-binding protein
MNTERDLVALAAENPILRECAETTRRSLFEHGTLRSFEDDSLVLADAEPGRVALFLLHGSLQMLKSTARGRRLIVCNPQSATCEGVCMLFFGDHGLAEVRGVDAGEMLVVERDVFQELTREDPVFCRSAWNGAAHCMAHLHKLVSQLSFNKVAERVITLLLAETAQDGDLVRLTQADLAANVGTTREVVARCLAGLQADGLIRLGRGRITVLRREKLRTQI